MKWCSFPTPIRTLCVSARSAAPLDAVSATPARAARPQPDLGEIVELVLLARDALGRWPKGTMASTADVDDGDDDAGHYTADGRMLVAIVMMGWASRSIISTRSRAR